MLGMVRKFALEFDDVTEQTVTTGLPHRDCRIDWIKKFKKHHTQRLEITT